jgi:hypothetical protein
MNRIAAAPSSNRKNLRTTRPSAGLLSDRFSLGDISTPEFLEYSTNCGFFMLPSLMTGIAYVAVFLSQTVPPAKPFNFKELATRKLFVSTGARKQSLHRRKCSCLTPYLGKTLRRM